MKKSVSIDNKIIGDGTGCYIIAEAGSNHNKDFETAFRLVDIAAEANADSVKFQIFSADTIAAKTKHPIAVIKDKFNAYGSTLHELYEKIETPREWLGEIANYCKKKRITFLCTPFDIDGVDQLMELNVSAFKIASFEMVDIPFLRYIAKKGKPMILSTGMATLGEIEESVTAITDEGNDDIVLLHCGIEYPPKWEDVNLAAMSTMDRAFPYHIGYSDHTLGNVVPVAAVALNAKVIEKHFTFDKNAIGPDHGFAASPEELKDMVIAIRNCELAIGSPIKRPTESEMIHLKRGRRSIFASCHISKGEVISKEMLSILRPNVGLSPKFYDTIIGRRAAVDIKAHEPITWNEI